MIVKAKRRKEKMLLFQIQQDYNSSQLSLSVLPLHLLSQGVERGRKREGRGNPLLRRTLSAVPNTETDRAEKEITATRQTRC